MRCLFLVLLFVAPVFGRPVPNLNTTAPHWKPQPPFYVPLGSVNLALHKPVTSSDDAPIIGELKMVTDGIKDGIETNQRGDGNWVELGPNTQWVQIDLQQKSRIFGVHIWHYYNDIRVYRDVIVQVSDDPDFEKGVRTIYNNDQNDSSGLGVGKDREFYESRFGQIIDARGANYEGVVARYVRLYSKGNTSDPVNQYLEVEVIGKAPNEKIDSAQFQANRAAMLRPKEHYFVASANAFIAQWDEKRGVEMLPPRYVNPWRAPSVAMGNYLPGTFRPAAKNTLPISATLANGPYLQADLGQHTRLYALLLPTHSLQDGETISPLNDFVVVAARDGNFTQNARVLFDGKRANLHKIKGYEKKHALLIDFGSQNGRGFDTRFLRLYSRRKVFDRSSRYWIDLIGVPTNLLERDRLMLWTTTYPPQPYM
jgi:hypothetical protein